MSGLVLGSRGGCGEGRLVGGREIAWAAAELAANNAIKAAPKTIATRK